MNPSVAEKPGKGGSASRRFAAEVLVLLVTVFLAVLWPGDTLWTNDEPRLIANAWHANQAGHPAWGGLWGNFGIRYGPFPTQFYQFLLLLTDNPLMLAMLRAGVCASVSAISLLWLARSLSFSPWFAGAALAAPLVLHYQRLLWDASFAMPLGALSLAAFASYLRIGKGWRLTLSIGSAAFLATVHPQDLPLAAAIGGMIAWKHRPAVSSQRKALLITLAAFLGLNAVFFAQLVQLIVTRLGGAVASGYPGGLSPGVAALAPFLGGRLLGGHPAPDTLGTLDTCIRYLATVIYPLCWVGIGIAGWHTWGFLRNRKHPGAGGTFSIASETTARRQVTVIALAAVVMQGLLFAVTRVPSEAQYFFGTFVAHIFLAWLAVESLPWRWLRSFFTAAYGLAAVWLSWHHLLITHRDGSPIRPYQPGLGSQVELARILNEKGAQAVFTDVAHLQKYAQGVRALRLLLPRSETGTGPRLLVRYGSGGPGKKPDELWVTEISETMPLTSVFEAVSVSPLEEGWYPPPK